MGWGFPGSSTAKHPDFPKMAPDGQEWWASRFSERIVVYTEADIVLEGVDFYCFKLPTNNRNATYVSVYKKDVIVHQATGK